MKRVISICMLLCCFCSYAQEINIPEPEFADETLIIQDGKGILLPRENMTNKQAASASAIIVNIGKVRETLYCEGVTSPIAVPQADTIALIVKGLNNLTDPRSYVNVFSFYVKKKKRNYLLGETQVFTGTTKENGFGSFPYTAKKYGESSYLIILEKLLPGEYGIYLGDPNAMSNKDVFKVTTFSVKAAEK